MRATAAQRAAREKCQQLAAGQLTMQMMRCKVLPTLGMVKPEGSPQGPSRQQNQAGQARMVTNLLCIMHMSITSTCQWLHQFLAIQRLGLAWLLH